MFSKRGSLVCRFICVVNGALHPVEYLPDSPFSLSMDELFLNKTVYTLYFLNQSTGFPATSASSSALDYSSKPIKLSLTSW